LEGSKLGGTEVSSAQNQADQDTEIEMEVKRRRKERCDDRRIKIRKRIDGGKMEGAGMMMLSFRSTVMMIKLGAYVMDPCPPQRSRWKSVD
jgi:hypothetical protein